MVAQGMPATQILAEHPDLEAEDIRASLEYARRKDLVVVSREV